MKALVTGASGFVGAAVARALLARGDRVRVLLRPAADRRNLTGLDVESVAGDLTDTDSLARAVAGQEAVFHVAADYRLWVPNPRAMYRANVRGTRNLLLAARDAGVARLVYTSSVATLGHAASGQAVDESRQARLEEMIGPYKRSKFLAEQWVRDFARGPATADMTVVIVNPSTPVGPGDIKPTPTGQMVRDAAAGRMPAYLDSGLNIVHVDDVAAGHVAALEQGRAGERYILGGENLSLEDIFGRIAALSHGRPPRWRLQPGWVMPVATLAEMVARITGATPRVTRDAVKMARQPMYFSSARARRELGYQPRPADIALADAVQWFRQQR